MSTDVGLRRVTTPRAAAWAGVLFALLFGASLVLVRTTIPADPAADPTWLTQGSGRLRTAMMLMPLSGIAFLWFIGVVRDRLGEHEDRFLASVFLGSGLMFLAMAFVATAIVGGLLVGVGHGADDSHPDEIVRFARGTMLQVSNVYALRMAAAFMISLGTIWRRSGLMPGWLVMLTYATALVLLVVTSLSLWTTLVFPGWVLVVSVLFLLRSYMAPADRDPAAR